MRATRSAVQHGGLAAQALGGSCAVRRRIAYGLMVQGGGLSGLGAAAGGRVGAGRLL